MYVRSDFIDELIESDGVYKGHSVAVCHIMSSDWAAGKVLFYDFWLAGASEVFHTEYRQMLKDLEHNDFKASEIAAYRMVTGERAKRIKSVCAGDASRKWRYHFCLHDTCLGSIDLDDPKDAPIHQLLNRVKSIGINSGQIRPFVWESLLFPKGTMPDTPSELELPGELLKLVNPAREYALDVVEDCATLPDAIKRLDKAASTILSKHSNFKKRPHVRARACVKPLGGESGADCARRDTALGDVQRRVAGDVGQHHEGQELHALLLHRQRHVQ